MDSELVYLVIAESQNVWIFPFSLFNDTLEFSLTVHQEGLPAALECHWEDCLLSPVPGSKDY